MENYLTTKEVAERLERTPSRIVQLIRLGDIPAIKRGNTYLINPADIENFKFRKITGRPPKE